MITFESNKMLDFKYFYRADMIQKLQFVGIMIYLLYNL